MKKFFLPLFLITIIAFIVGWFSFLLTRVNIQVLNPKGLIASGERDLIFISMGIMLSIAIPVVIFALLTIWRFRSGNKKAKHDLEGKGNKWIVAIYWLFFVELMLVFFFLAWRGAHELDPHKPIFSREDPITIQVVALRWKWLFIYPEENIATVNFLQIPVNSPINFKLTSDGPMNSFWIPQLGGQIYSMAGMQTKIHLIANEIGDFKGEAAEINGKGFAGMRFVTRSSSREDYDAWVAWVKNESKPLNNMEYKILETPSENDAVMYFSEVEEGLYNNIMMKFMQREEHGESESNGH